MSRLELPLREQANKVDRSALFSDLQQAIQGEVRFDRLAQALYSTDASVFQIVPLGVVLPRTEEDIVATVRACARLGIPLTARGGGTSQAGQCIGPGIILDCSKYFHDILEINAAERWVRVRPGCVLDDLNQTVAAHGLQFAPDISTSSRATLGGMIANNSSGTHSFIHGKTIDHVLELRAVLADGSILHTRPSNSEEWTTLSMKQDLEGACYRAVTRLAEKHAEEIDRRYPKILRRVGGYNLDCFAPVGRISNPSSSHPDAKRTDWKSVLRNLSHLFVGSEGTLGIVVEAKLRLIELPKVKAVLVVQFHDLLEALAATPLILTHHPSAVEVMDRYILDSTRLNPDASRLRTFLEGDPASILLIEFYGDHPAEMPLRLEALETDLQKHGYGYHFLRATDAQMQQRIWKLRTLALGLSMAEKGDAKAISFVEDTAVAPENLRNYISEMLEIIRRHGTRAGVYAHASVGCLHVRPVINLKTIEGIQQFQSIAEEVADLVLKYGGALSGEHGDGLVRSPFQEKMFGPALYQAFRELKKTFDPLGIFNPGKIIDAPPLTANLRCGSSYRTPEVPTTFDFSVEGGLTRAAELCAGVGECRKKRGGTMCPSYRATREEQHSTRGRANALRLALTGQLDFTGLTDPALHAVMDLCLECKACKSECPTNVDMARLKAEFLHQYHRRHGFPLRARVLGNVASLSRWGSRLAPLSSWLARWAPVRWLNERLLGIDRRRLPPRFTRKTLRQWRRSIEQEDRGEFTKRVLLFPDTFTNHYQPEIGLAAVDLLHQGRWAVTLGSPDLDCCGRPLISSGLLDQAVRLAKRNVALLYPWAAAGNPIIACEPSCILTIADDYPALLRGEERRQAEVVASRCLTFEQALDQLASSGEFSFRGGPKQVLVQGHCHQRSLVGMASLIAVLRRIPGAEVTDLDAGCCGMAGAFGYECEHYEVSRQVGEQRLFPALRQASPETVVAVPGFSCRLQIAHFTQRTAVHPAQLLRGLLEDRRAGASRG
jgi:FAD/FMN-containing dehydrogenase/Fe-S oxidoreductase